MPVKGSFTRNLPLGLIRIPNGAIFRYVDICGIKKKYKMKLYENYLIVSHTVCILFFYFCSDGDSRRRSSFIIELVSLWFAVMRI